MGQAQGGAELPPPGFADYGKWEALSTAGARGGLSPDGRWVTYAINRTNGDNELRITELADRSTAVIAFGAQPAYSSDSRWIAYSIGQSEAEPERMRENDQPVQTKLGLRNLGTGETTTIDGIESFSFSAEDRLGNGVQFFDAATSELRVLESSEALYGNALWREDALDLVVLRGKEDDAKEAATEVVLAWTGLEDRGTLHSYDPTADPSFPAGMRTVPFRSPSWSTDGSVLFLEIAAWEDKVVPPGGAEGEPAERWITEGKSFLERDRELKRMEAKR